MSTNNPTKGDLKEEGGITKDEVVAFGEYDVLKEEVLQTLNLENCAKRTTSSIHHHTSYFYTPQCKLRETLN